MDILKSLKFGLSFQTKQPKESKQQPKIENKEEVSIKHNVEVKHNFPDCSNITKEIKLLIKRKNNLVSKESKDSKEVLLNEYKMNKIMDKITSLKNILYDKMNFQEGKADDNNLPLCSFEEIKKSLKLKDNFEQIIKDHYGFTHPSPIQSVVIPYLNNNSNLIATSQTGSGKTLAYLIPIITKLNKLKDINLDKKAIFILPTKELCNQIFNECNYFCNFYTNFSIKPKLVIGSLLSSVTANNNEFESFIKNNDIFIGTPGNILSIITCFDNNLLKKLKYFVVDEADHILDKGFNDIVYDILNLCINHELKVNKQKSSKNDSTKLSNRIVKTFFSATISPRISELLESKIVDIKRISIGNSTLPCSNIIQEFKYCTNYKGKIFEIIKFLGENTVPPVLVFVDSIDNGKKLFEEVKYNIPKINLLHSQMTKEAREEIIKKLRIGEIWVLITSDLIARGIDFKNIKTVINFDCPESSTTYIHRIGRSGRAGNNGSSITYIVDEDRDKLRNLDNILNKGVNVICPDWMKKIK